MPISQIFTVKPPAPFSRQRLISSALGVFIFSMVANGFAYFNFYPQHDSINHALTFSTSWEVSLGRFMLPLYGEAFGDITAPWLVGVLSMVALTGATFLISDLYQLNNLSLTFLLGGLFSANMTVTEMCASFIYVDASYLFAFFLSTLSMYLVIKHPAPPVAIAAAIILSISMGFYQSYVACALLLLLFSVAKDTLSDRHLLKVSLRKWSVYILTLLLTMLFYLVEYKISMDHWGVTSPDSGNSPSQLLKITPHDLLSRFKTAYKSFLGFFYTNERSIGFIFTTAHIILTVLAAILLICYLFKQKLPLLNHIVLFCLIVVYPLLALLIEIAQGATGIYFITSFSIFMLYPGLLLIIYNVRVGQETVYSTFPILRKIVVVLVAVILWQNIVFSNGAYTTQKLLYDRTLSITTRILDDVDETPGYVLKETPVVVIGIFHYDENLDIMTTYCDWLSGFHKASTTYVGTFDSLTRLLGYKLNIVSDSTVLYQYQNSDVVQQMPSYPVPGYCQMVDGSLVIKLS